MPFYNQCVIFSKIRSGLFHLCKDFLVSNSQLRNYWIFAQFTAILVSYFNLIFWLKRTDSYSNTFWIPIAMRLLVKNYYYFLLIYFQNSTGTFSYRFGQSVLFSLVSSAEQWHSDDGHNLLANKKLIDPLLLALIVTDAGLSLIYPALTMYIKINSN